MKNSIVYAHVMSWQIIGGKHAKLSQDFLSRDSALLCWKYAKFNQTRTTKTQRYSFHIARGGSVCGKKIGGRILPP